MSSVLAANVEPGRAVEGAFVLVRKQRRHGRTGDAYLVVELADSSGTIEGRVWRNADWFDRNLREGDRVHVVGVGTLYRDAVQVDVRRMDPVAADGADGEHFVPAARRAEDELVGELEFLVGEVGAPDLRRLVEAVWNGPDRELLVRSPATARDHHAYLNGLVEHTVSVAAIALAAAERHERVDRDLLLAAALVHDVGRAREIEVGATIAIDHDGGLVGHLVLGHELLVDAVDRAGVGRPEWWPGFVHAVQQHHSAPERCRTREAVILASANALDARLGSRDR